MRQQPTNQTAGLRPEDDGQPLYLYPDYVATRLRVPKKPLIILPSTLSDTTGPVFGRGPIGELDNDLTRQHVGEPLGERIIVTGRVLDGDGRPVRSTLIEIWQANAAGRYHLRAALRNGLTQDEIKEVLLQSAIYCGVPAANSAFAQRVLADNDQHPEAKADAPG